MSAPAHAGAGGRSHAISAEETKTPGAADAGLPRNAFAFLSSASASAAATPKRNRQNDDAGDRSAPATNTGDPPKAGPSRGTADTATGVGAFEADVSSAAVAAARSFASAAFCFSAYFSANTVARAPLARSAPGSSPFSSPGRYAVTARPATPPSFKCKPAPLVS